MTEEPAHEQMERHAALTDELAAISAERDAVKAGTRSRPESHHRRGDGNGQRRLHRVRAQP